MGDGIPVKVFVRARPFNDKERLENARECLQIFVESNQISCNGRSFTFDGVLDPSTSQDSVYDVTTSSLLEQFFKGFNCTVLAYGQTGSGKTFTMGTEETTASVSKDTRGIIPRLVDAIFKQISESDMETNFKVLVSMLEIYDEKVQDLLSGAKDQLQIRELSGSVFVQGLSKTLVTNLQETMAQLEKGGSLRSKGQTAMNAQSSRSHAIFTISLEKSGIGDDDTGFTAKLHLVDLAGSERLKKTQAEGTRKMEGIRINEDVVGAAEVELVLEQGMGSLNIFGSSSSSLAYSDMPYKRTVSKGLRNGKNEYHRENLHPPESNKRVHGQGRAYHGGTKGWQRGLVIAEVDRGLLALGNVISALSETGANRHIPYRDSKITRLLQDSLGGNSYTVMIACVSPADSNAEETLSTLRYADRAKKIKNKPVVNIDAGQQKIMELKERVATLERELAEARMGFAPCQAGSEISSFEITQMKAIMVEKDNLLKLAHEKTAEIMYQKINLLNQLHHVELQRERLKSMLSQTAEILNDDDEKDNLEKIRRINDIVSHEAVDYEEREHSMSRGDHGDTLDDEPMDETFSIKFIDKQTFLDKELDDVMQQIKDKEELLSKAVESQKNVDELMKQHQQEMTSLQQRIDALMAEKTKLEADLRKISVNNKLAEERRRKLMEMEKQLAMFRKQMNEMKKLEKQKQQSEEIQKRMQAEITALKQAKVRMVKQQREESEKYRQWKLKHDRELIQVKQKERKREFEVVREKRAHDQQMMVCKQKLEEAKNINKRLLAQMEKSAAFSREKPNSEKSYDQAKQFIEAELSLIGSSYEAERMCQSLKDQRRRLGRKKAQLQRQRDYYVSSEEPHKKRRSTEEGAALSAEEAEALRKIDEELEKIDNQQMLCTDELNKLQRGCGSIDVDSRAESRWKDIFTLTSARVFLKALFDQAANERKSMVDSELELKRLQEEMKELDCKRRDEKSEYEEELGIMKDNNRRLAAEAEKHIAHSKMEILNLVDLMTTSSNTVDADAVEELKRICEKVERINEVKQELQNAGVKHSRGGKTKGLARSRSSSCMEQIVPLTTEEERRTRSKRHTINRFGDVKDPTKVVEDDSDDEPSTMDDSYRPSTHPVPRNRKRKPKIVTDLSPILDLTRCQEHNAEEDVMNVSPRSRRLSMMLHRPPSTSEDGELGKENAWNETFIVEERAAGQPACGNSQGEAMEGNPTMNATLVSGLLPHMHPTLGPL